MLVSIRLPISNEKSDELNSKLFFVQKEYIKGINGVNKKIKKLKILQNKSM